jgi:hypothetical protein
MKKTKSAKLVLTQETLRSLREPALADAAGAVLGSADAGIPMSCLVNKCGGNNQQS